MNKGLSLLSGVGFGAGLMYLWDPDRGRRRRALIRDKAVHMLNKTDDALDATVQDLTNRINCYVAEALHLFRRDQASDAVIVERVRAKMGRIVTHPSSILVTCDQGIVTLRGPILSREADPLIAVVASLRGVRGVEDRLERHETAGDIPGLQGVSRRPGIQPEFLQANWSPSARLVACVAGGTLALSGIRRGGVFGPLLGLTGLALLARGLTNKEVKRIVGVNSGHRAVDIQKTLNINAPRDLVFAFWTNYDNFPHFMSSVREVRDLGGGRSHWVVAGPAGVPIEWDAEVTRIELNKELGWKTLPGAPVEHAGLIKFDTNPDGSTRVHILFSYNPPAGALGHTVADLLGFDPKARMDQDLARMKTLIETGKTPHDAAQPEVITG